MGQFIPLAIGAASTGGQVLSQSKAAEQETTALREQQVQSRMQAEQQSINTNKQLEDTLSNAQAQSAARGISEASPSFRAVQEKSIQSGINADRVNDLNLSIKENQLRQEIDATQARTLASQFGSLLDFGKATSKFWNIKAYEWD